MLKFFKNNSQAVIFLIPIIGAILWLPIFLGKATILTIDYNLSPLFGWLGAERFNDTFLYHFVDLALFIGLAFYLIRLNTKFLFLRLRTQLPGITFVLIAVVFAYYLETLPIVVSGFLVLLAIERMFDGFKKEGLSYEFIDAAALISLGSLVFFPLIFFHILIWLIIFIIKPRSWREWFFVLIGAIIPFALFYSLGFIFGWNTTLPFRKLFTIQPRAELFDNIVFEIYLYILAALTVISSLQMVKLFPTKKIQSRKFLTSLFGLFVFSIILAILPFFPIHVGFLSILSVTYLIAHYLHYVNNPKIGEAITITLSLAVLASGVLQFIQ